MVSGLNPDAVICESFSFAVCLSSFEERRRRMFSTFDLHQ
jgi:hypothetical protein